MLIEWFLSIKSLPNLLFGVLCLPGDQSHPFAQPTINPLARCICWAGLLGRAVFPPWNEGPNFGSYRIRRIISRELPYKGIYPNPDSYMATQSSAVVTYCFFNYLRAFLMCPAGPCLLQSSVNLSVSSP